MNIELLKELYGEDMTVEKLKEIHDGTIMYHDSEQDNFYYNYYGSVPPLTILYNRDKQKYSLYTLDELMEQGLFPHWFEYSAIACLHCDGYCDPPSWEYLYDISDAVPYEESEEIRTKPEARRIFVDIIKSKMNKANL